jgi:hypothetical protein
VFTDPVVISSDIIKDNKPVNLKGGDREHVLRALQSGRDTDIVATLHAGFHCRSTVSFIFRKSVEALTEAGWKSDIEKQIFLSGAKRPEGVSIWKELVCKRVVWLIARAHLDTRWLERVFWRKHQNPMVLSSFERRIRGATLRGFGVRSLEIWIRNSCRQLTIR